ncbi:MAG: hypothetical protein CVU43_01210 [Chloroflexi bacterium HGW-Chloroflexi-5]|jgi:hypothetical protein|nr:MAG: hypothetical protein CVU43_01210 [Chloroflexi bacterium HGW-Chloroflexi-5]
MIKFDTQQVEIKPLVYFIGLSAKKNCKHLDEKTRTGHIVEEIVDRLPSVQVIKTNLVKEPPLNADGKLRYPNYDEMTVGWYQLKSEIIATKPTLLVILGQQVSLFLRSQMGIQPSKPLLPSDFSSKAYLTQATDFILSIHHPSYVYIYHRNDIERYIENVVISVSDLLFENHNFSFANNAFLN